MHLTTASAGAATGLLAGPWIRAAVFRLSVPPGAPDRTACPRCGSRLRSASACRCPSCRERVTLPCGATEIASAAVLGTIAGTVGPRPELIAFAWLAVLCIALATIDLIVYRLPDQLTLPAYPVIAALLAGAALLNSEPDRFLRAVLAGIALAAGYLVLALIRPGDLGLGDVKLAGPLGMVLGWAGWQSVLLGTALSFVLCGLAGAVLLAVRRADARTALPLGPFMVCATFVVLLVTPGQ
ncbi:prepilin peptidase [Lentzea aerocolonigenes]|uniref:prepilin peptidase n=1 Tax=Lentzea aerocolonigenes TaxID=68170 RepID=UPI0004C3688D|nr:A24 family peptidase [Lentzea aerocolonigenes]